jgi:hypothetical protein
LGNVGAKAAVALPELKPLTEDPDGAIRDAAKSAVERIESSTMTNAAASPAQAD